MSNTTNKEILNFPFIRLIVCSIIGGALIRITSIQPINEKSIIYIPYLLAFVYTFVLCLIPMTIAYKRNTTNKNAIYWLTFLLPIPFGIILYIFALLLAIFSESNNKNTKEYKIKNLISTFKLNNIIHKKLNIKIVVFILLSSLVGAFYYLHIDNEIEILKLKIYNECMNNTDAFFDDMDDSLVSTLSNSGTLEKFRNQLYSSCECENKAIISSIINPYKRLKYMRSIASSYNYWESYYKKNDNVFYEKYKKNKRICNTGGKVSIYKNLTEKLSSYKYQIKSYLNTQQGIMVFWGGIFIIILSVIYLTIKILDAILGVPEKK